MRVICVTGGKGGIGKTTISINLAIAYAKMKKKVLLFDADLSLANVDIRLGLTPNKNINDFLSGNCDLSEVCITGPHGIKVIPSSSGIQKMAELSAAESFELIRSFSSLTDDIDIMIIDMAPGISTQVIELTHASQDILIVVCNDPASLMDSYAIIKILHQKYGRDRFGVLVNKVKNLQEGYDVFTRFQDAIVKFINVSMHYIGHLPQDDYVSIAACEGVSIVDKFPHCEASIAFNHLCHGLNHWHEENSMSGGIQFFFERLIQNRLVPKDKPCIA
ncbi:MAG: AAA family ATPase [Gammaproteobacteria bacterium]|nr:AAA family ATPase [Gammaproteobacteria bacterium]